MNKKSFLGSSILYKRPISKNNTLYNCPIPNSTNNKQTVSFNFGEEEQYSKTKLTSSVYSNFTKANYDSLNPYYKINKKVNNIYPHSYSSRISINNFLNKNKIRKNIINNINDNNSIYYQDKGNDNKIFQNYNNNTCNISLNQHFYNIDYNNYTSPNTTLKRNATENNVERSNLNNYNYIDRKLNKQYKNLSINKPNNKKSDNNFYLNTVANSFPIYFNKEENISNEYIDSHSNTFFFSKKETSNNLISNNYNKFNFIPKKNKKISKINLIKVNSKKRFLNCNINNISNLNSYTNFVRVLTHRKNLVNNNDNNIINIHKTKSTSINSFKYKKKIVNYNSFNRKKEENDIFVTTMRKRDNNYKNQFSIVNKTQEQINNYDLKNMKKNNKGNNSFIFNKMDALNQKIKININKINNYNIKNQKNNKTFENSYHTAKHTNINKKINYYLNPKYINRLDESNNNLDKNPSNSSIPILKYTFNKFNNKKPKKKMNSKISISYKNFNYENNEKTFNNSLFKLNNINSIDNKNYLSLKKDNSLYENYEKLNNNKLNKNIDMDKIECNKKHIILINNNKNKLKNINLNNKQNINSKKINSKMTTLISKREKEIANLKKNFLNHFSKDKNNNNNNNDNLEKIKLNKKNKKNNNYKPRKQKETNNINIENSFLTNNSLSELINKFRQSKKISKNNKIINKNFMTKKNILSKQYNFKINQSNSLNNLKINNNFENIQNNYSTTRIQKKKKSIQNLSNKSPKNKDCNEYMEQSLKLSKYIKDYYLKNNNYPKTDLNFYRIGRKIGQGGFAKVNLGLNVLTGRVVAIKSFDKTKKTKYGDNLNMDKILYEINLMQKLNHPNITKILETFEDEKFYFIIMEYINGGNLFSFVKKRRKLSEKVAKFLFKQIILGIKHIHSQLIVHRDIKLENILIDMNNTVKICDFGIGIILSSEDQVLHSHCGTPMYIAPEIILSNKEKGYLGFPVDIWSAGIVLYIMLSGKLPFNIDDDFQDDFDGYNNNIKEKNAKLRYEIINNKPKYIENISDEARNLLNGLLEKNPFKRLTCDQILNHPWFSEISNNKNHLFSKDEKKLLSKTYIDYRKSKLDDLIENFTLSNLFNDKKNTDIEYNNCESKSSLLAPFNSLNYDLFNSNIDIEFNYDYKENDMFDDFKNKKLLIEKDLLTFSIKAKELNYQYELNNNKEVDNGVLINSKSVANSSSSSFSNNTKRNEKFLEYENEFKGIDYISKEKIERILDQMESMGYDRDYILKCVKNNYLNHAATVFFLLIQYENI